MFTGKHNPHGGTLHCDNGRIETLIADYQTSGDVKSLDAIVTLTQARALTLIRFYRTTRYWSKDELLSDVNFKPIKAVDKCDPAKGTAFTFLSCLIQNALHTAVSNARRSSSRHVELGRGPRAVFGHVLLWAAETRFCGSRRPTATSRRIRKGLDGPVKG